MALNSTSKLLAIAGAFQVAVIVLPRPGYSRLVPELIDCTYVFFCQFFTIYTAFPSVDLFQLVNSITPYRVPHLSLRLNGILGVKQVPPYL